jgi:ribosomal protein S18 acetylase RimI-like enzyme
MCKYAITIANTDPVVANLQTPMTQVAVRKATSADAQAIMAHMKRTIAEPGVHIPFAPEEYDPLLKEEQKRLCEFAESDNSIVLVADAEEQVIGILECKGGTREAMRHVTSLSMSVRKEWRNRGVGSALLARAIEWAKATGTVKRIELFVYAQNTAAIHLYRTFGFEEEGRCRGAIYQNGEFLDDLIMALYL